MNKSFSKTVSKMLISGISKVIDDPIELKKAIKKLKNFPKSKEGKAFDKQMNNAKAMYENDIAICIKSNINSSDSIISYITKGNIKSDFPYRDCYLNETGEITKVVFSTDRSNGSEYYWMTKNIFKLINKL